MVISLERGADLHMAQLMLLPLTVSCSSKIQMDKGPFKCVCVCLFLFILLLFRPYGAIQRALRVCRAYVGLLCEAIRLHAAHSPVGITVAVIYLAFSAHSSLERRWEPVITAVYAEMLKRPMVYHSSPDASEWIEPKSAVFNNLDPADEVMIQQLERVGGETEGENEWEEIEGDDGGER